MATVVPVEVERDYADRSSAPPHAHRECEPPTEEREPAEGGYRSKESRAGPGIQIKRAREYDRPGHEEPTSGAHRRHRPPGDRPGDDEQRQGVIHLIPNAGLERGEEIGRETRAQGVGAERARRDGHERRGRAERGEEPVHQSTRRPVTSIRRYGSMRPDPPTNVDANQLVRPTMMEPRMAEPSPLSVNPGMSHATTESEMPLTTRMKRPRVSTVNGNVRMRITGLMTAFTMPSSSAATSRLPQPSIWTPGTILAAAQRPRAVIRSRKKNPLKAASSRARGPIGPRPGRPPPRPTATGERRGTPSGTCPNRGRRPPAEAAAAPRRGTPRRSGRDRKSTRLNSSHPSISYAVFCLKKKNADTILVFISMFTIKRHILLQISRLSAPGRYIPSA